MMDAPTIQTAKRIAYDRQASLGAVVIAFDKDGKVAGASYGHTRQSCDLLRKVLDRIIDGIGDGSLVPVSPT